MAYFKCDEIVDPVFGTGALGDVTISTTTSWNADTEDSGVIEKNFHNLTINSGVTVSAGNRNAGMIIRCTGNCTIHGILTNRRAPKTLLTTSHLEDYYPSYMVGNGRGGNGGNGGNAYRGNGTGAGQTGRYYGGGYSGGGSGGGCYPGSYGLNGGQGGSAEGITISITSIFEGGDSVAGYQTWGNNGNQGTYGGGGSGAAGGNATESASSTSGAGGSGAGGNGGGGSTSGYALGSSGGGAGNIGGGVIIIYCKGILTIDGTINCNGNNGGNGGGGDTSGGWKNISGAAGGGSGGGRIYLMSKGTMSLDGSFLVNGGSAGSGNTYNTSPTAGGAGTKHYISYANFNRGAGTPTPIAS